MQALDRIFVALSDPNRRRMAERLSRGPATVKQLAEPVEMRLPSAVKHLKVLEDSGIVVSRKDGRARTYSLQPAALMLIADWVRDREAALNAAFDRLEAAMREIPEEETGP
ncbi:ArsR/SmtB family transcription factor [Inquilinus limosus]|uniref:ArsR/SmtB family transcription factor n=1 Tax=Inquilinus limosus TaxID=171674 RepID=UPI00041E2BD3|nr:metalloregulator ArsR/SmtB family transcription factor [Inquilinus limosus]